MALAACTPGGGGVGSLGGPGGGISGTTPPGAPPSGAPELGDNTNPGGPPPGASGASGEDSSKGPAVQPLGSGVVAPATDVAHDNEPKANIDSVSMCSFEDKVKIHITGIAISGAHPSGNQFLPLETDYYEDGRALRIVDKLGKEYIETKIKSTPMGARDGKIISFSQEGVFDVTLILDHLPVKMLDDPFAVSTLWFYMTDTAYVPPVLDQMQSCPNLSCIASGWTFLESPYSSAYIIEAAKSFGACSGLQLQHMPAVNLNLK